MARRNNRERRRFGRERRAAAGVAPGDLFATRVVDRIARDDPACEDGGRYVLASFHGDTNGLATVPVVDALDKHALLLDPPRRRRTTRRGSPRKPPRQLVFGMDANTHAAHVPNEKQGVRTSPRTSRSSGWCRAGASSRTRACTPRSTRARTCSRS